MDDELNALRRTRMRWNTPLSEAHAELLLDRMALEAGQHLVDLGCGWGELLLRALARTPGLRATGVDTDLTGLDRGRAAARERGVAVDFAESDAATWAVPAERAFCIGAAHIFGSTEAALEGLTRVVPSGRLLYGDGFWAAPPNAAAEEIFGPDTLTLPDLLDVARAAGWRVLHFSTADQLEWDDFESTSRAGWQEWVAAHPADPRAAEVRDWLDGRLGQYVRDYRGVLGFTYLVLGR
ncbi:SAM-dependent methyltransferase [Amycolatopsis sp. NPDC051758]|uniref:SAM-dependent methyltransferase n=1 Tax=Amycolatopsis sp. NPDC051758 TaxID=3363935 RepID=UPI0037AEEA4A